MLLILLCSGMLAGPLAVGDAPAKPAAYQTAKAKAGRDADSHIRLALWFEAHGQQAERLNHLEIALQIDPDNATAHGLLGQVANQGRWEKSEEAAALYRADANLAETLAQYHARRDKLPETAEAHGQMAEWCKQNGLGDEAVVHLAAVVRLDPRRESAWKKLGYQKHNGRWVAAEQMAAGRAEIDARRRADARWRPLLRKWKDWLGQKRKRAEVERALTAIVDPRAVPAIWSVFATGGPGDQERAVLLLHQVDAPAAALALASLSVLGASAEVQRLAANSLAGRDPREFAALLIGMLREPVNYEVRQVGGPGTPGELYIKGERANTRRFYAAPAPLATLNPGEVVGFDSDGLPVINRVVGYRNMPLAGAIDPFYWGAPNLTGVPDLLSRAGLGAAGRGLGQRMIQNQQQATAIGESLQRTDPYAFIPAPLEARVPVGQLMAQAEQQAELSRRRLEEDVAALARYNADVGRINDRAVLALRTALGTNPGPNPGDWVKWVTDLAERTTSASPCPKDRERGADDAQVGRLPWAPSFAAGTPVWTLSGLRPAEEIRAGDKVLTQDTASGALGFVPAVTIRQVAREPVKEIRFGDAAIIGTDLERFWVAGKGWVMARDLKLGDTVRVLGGVVRVAAIEDAAARPVCHIQVPEGRGIFVGQPGILAHDDRLYRPVSDPFDAAASSQEPGTGARLRGTRRAGSEPQGPGGDR
jgi:hypothetical protein